MKGVPFTTLTPDQSADFMSLSLKARIPFFFTKYGDGALQCIHKIGHGTRDGEPYTQGLAASLLRSWDVIRSYPYLYLADWLSASFDEREHGMHEDLYREFVANARPVWLHYQAVLIERQSDSLLNFYRTLKEDPRRKVIMGPVEWAPAMDMLNAEKHIVTPMKDLFGYIGNLDCALHDTKADIVLYGAGMAGTIPVIEQWRRRPDATYISLGSALDPLFRKNSRIDQLPMRVARQFFRELL